MGRGESISLLHFHGEPRIREEWRVFPIFSRQSPHVASTTRRVAERPPAPACPRNNRHEQNGENTGQQLRAIRRNRCSIACAALSARSPAPATACPNSAPSWRAGLADLSPPRRTLPRRGYRPSARSSLQPAQPRHSAQLRLPATNESLPDRKVKPERSNDESADRRGSCL
jgi:hypothetical protein